MRWMLPLARAEHNANGYLPGNVKLHCFYEDVSLCKKYYDDVDNNETIVENDLVLSNPLYACKLCFTRWIRKL